MMIGLSRCEALAVGAVAPTSLAFGKRLMRAARHGRILALASTALSLMLAVPLGALAQDSNETAATFNERFSIEQSSAPRSPALSEAKKERSVTTTRRVVSAKRPRSRVVVAPRSFLDAGREVPPRERKPPVYAFSPLHTPLDVVTNTGGRVGWDNLPLPGPLFPMP
jgi:hypothetical protein